MKPPKDVPGSPEEWMSHASSDLALAKLAVGNQNILSSQICFHAQQAAEKAIKAVLLFRKVNFPLTHDLDVLLELLEQSGLILPKDVLNAGQLTPYAIEARYPGGAESSESDIQSSIKLAQSILGWANQFLI